MRYALAFILFVALGAVSNVRADDFVVDSTEDVSMQAPGGHYQEGLYEISPSGPSALRARVTFGKFEDDPQWLPSFSFSLVNGESFVGFTVVRFKPNELTAFFRRFHGKTDKQETVFDFKPRPGEPFALVMEWTADGKMAVSIGDGEDGPSERREIDFRLRPEKIRIIASGGSLEIKPLEFGHMESVATVAWTQWFDGAPATHLTPVRSVKMGCVPPKGATSFCQAVR